MSAAAAPSLPDQHDDQTQTRTLVSLMLEKVTGRGQAGPKNGAAGVKSLAPSRSSVMSFAG
jgi:hypothetical protein